MNNRRSTHKGTARVSRFSSGTVECEGQGFLSDLPHLQQKAFMSFPTNPSARKANIFYTKCNTHFDKLIPRLNLDDKGRNTLRKKVKTGLFVVNLILHKLWQTVQAQVARVTGETNYPRLSD